ncbi:MAG TPA: CHASE sensor domain-containing protein, partial [Gammaproteobacteria bacterium]|nr:CHASE sensor domain-containing protein [Gammaproteobacteria bacterium]
MRLRFRLRSVRYKLFVGVLLTSIAALLVTGSSLLAYDLHNLRATLADDLTTQAELIGRACVPALQFDDPKAANDNLALLRARPLIDGASLYNAKGMIFGSYSRPGAVAASFPQLPGDDAVDFAGENITVTRRIVDNNEIVGSIYLHAHYNLYQRVRNYLGIVLAVGSLALLVSLLLSTWLQATVTRPILDITKVAQQVIEKRDYSPRASKSTDDEIGYLVDAFNRMLAEIGRRAQALEATNQELAHEVAERKNAEDEILRLNRELEARV